MSGQCIIADLRNAVVTRAGSATTLLEYSGEGSATTLLEHSEVSGRRGGCHCGVPLWVEDSLAADDQDQAVYPARNLHFALRGV